MQVSHGFVFDQFHLDLHDERLWHGHQVVHLHPKTFAVLCCLVRQAGQLVTKDALLAAVWPETMVSESVITVAIRQLRRVLGDATRTPRFIATGHGRGYRFIAPLSAPASPAGPEASGGSRLAPPPLFKQPPHFVGRDAALAHLSQWWITARQGTRQVYLSCQLFQQRCSTLLREMSEGAECLLEVLYGLAVGRLRHGNAAMIVGDVIRQYRCAHGCIL
jgi:DNA-binding winged helix-turn-helix (wHTH) protein